MLTDKQVQKITEGMKQVSEDFKNILPTDLYSLWKDVEVLNQYINNLQRLYEKYELEYYNFKVIGLTSLADALNDLLLKYKLHSIGNPDITINTRKIYCSRYEALQELDDVYTVLLSKVLVATIKEEDLPIVDNFLVKYGIRVPVKNNLSTEIWWDGQRYTKDSSEALVFYDKVSLVKYAWKNNIRGEDYNVQQSCINYLPLQPSVINSKRNTLLNGCSFSLLSLPSSQPLTEMNYPILITLPTY